VLLEVVGLVHDHDAQIQRLAAHQAAQALVVRNDPFGRRDLRQGVLAHHGNASLRVNRLNLALPVDRQARRTRHQHNGITRREAAGNNRLSRFAQSHVVSQ
jgi:hypothetical protein